jgi:hypothetical protein
LHEDVHTFERSSTQHLSFVRLKHTFTGLGECQCRHS